MYNIIMTDTVEVGVLLTPTQMDLIAKSIKSNKPLKLNFSKKQVLGTHIFHVTKKQADKLKKDAEKGSAQLDLTINQLKRFVNKEGRKLFVGKGVIEDEQEKEIVTKKKLVKKDLAKKVKKKKFASQIISDLKALDKLSDITDSKDVQDAINKNLIIYGLMKPPKKGSGARDAFLGICQRLGIKTELDECHLKGHNYTGPGTKIEKKISNLEELDEKFAGDLSKLTLKDLKFKDDKWKPVNRIDEISAVHDVQYRLAGKTAKDGKDEIKLQNEADFIMMQKLMQMKKSNPTTQEKYEYYIVYPAILAKMNIEQSGVAQTAIAIKDNISELGSIAEGKKGFMSGMYSIVSRTMGEIAERIGLKNTSEKLHGNIWNSLLEASAEFTKDVVTDVAKVIGATISGKKVKHVAKEITTELKMPVEATQEEIEEKVEDIKEFEEMELSAEVPVVESKEEQLEEVKEEAEKVAEELPPQSQPTVLITQVAPKKKRGKGIGMKVPKEFKKVHALFSDELEDFMSANNIQPFDFIMRNGDKPDIQDEHYILVNLDDKNGGGTHYTGIFIKDGEATYFDPFGLPPPNEIKRWIKNNDIKLQYASNQLQPKKSIMCGYYVALFLYMMSKGTTPYDFLHDKGFEHEEVEKNDRILKDFFKIN